MCVSIVGVKHLRFAHLLQGCTCFEHQFYGHLVKDLASVRWVIGEVKYDFNAADSSRIVGPFVNSLRDLLQGPPVDKDSVLALRRKATKLIRVHPCTHFLKRLHWQTARNIFIVADWRSIEFTKTDAIDSKVLRVWQNQVAPHFHLSLSSVNILLDSMRENKGKTISFKKEG